MGKSHIGEIVLAEDEWVYPGEVREVLIKFLNVEDLKKKLTTGCTWRIQEGYKHVADATVLAQLDKQPQIG